MQFPGIDIYCRNNISQMITFENNQIALVSLLVTILSFIAALFSFVNRKNPNWFAVTCFILLSFVGIKLIADNRIIISPPPPPPVPSPSPIPSSSPTPAPTPFGTHSPNPEATPMPWFRPSPSPTPPSQVIDKSPAQISSHPMTLSREFGQQLEELTIRIETAAQVLSSFKAQQTRQSLGLRGDMLDTERRMYSHLNAARDAFRVGDSASFRTNFCYAEGNLRIIQEFLHLDTLGPTCTLPSE